MNRDDFNYYLAQLRALKSHQDDIDARIVKNTAANAVPDDQLLRAWAALIEK